MKKSLNYYFLFNTLLFMTACTSTTEHIKKPAPVEDRSTIDSSRVRDRPVIFHDLESIKKSEPATGKSEISSSKSTVVVALLDNAQRAVNAGNHESAAATLERAIRLQPKNALLWHRLGKLRLQQDNWQQAIALARKSNSLAAGEHILQASNWRIIAKAKQGTGDNKGAKEAYDMAESLSK